MQKYSFRNDYSEGAHPNILKLLAEINDQQEAGYGLDSISLKAVELIKTEINNQDAEIHFVSGGTQANLLVLGAILKPHESVIAAESGHINVHEAGAIEATGHRINIATSSQGKLSPEAIAAVVGAHQGEHMVKPKAVFISQATELGTIYSKAELSAISNYCRENDLYLYLDGARLGSALASSKSDISLAELASLVDVFYIGGTKNGALLGEAIVIVNKNLQADFRYALKQRGALLAKGKALGAQFMALFSNNLYFELAKHANQMADILRAGLKDKGYGFLAETSSNQVFPILPNELISKLEQDYGFYVWEKVDAQKSAIRLVTSWATPEEKVREFLANL